MLGEIIDKFTKKFAETIFVKTDSELEKQIEALEILLKKYPNSDFLKNKLKMCKIGLQGEKEIEFELKIANIGISDSLFNTLKKILKIVILIIFVTKK